MRAVIRGACAAALTLLAAVSLSAQASGETAGFVVTIGRDTLAVEQYTRAADRITGALVSRTPRTVTRSYTAWLNADGSVQRMEMTSRVPGTTQPPTVATSQFVRDSVITRIQRGDSVYQFRVAAAHAFPLVNYSHVFYEAALMHARALHADSLALTLVPIGSNQSYAMSVRTLGADSMLLVNLAGTQRVAADAHGRLLGLDGMQSTQKFVVTRVASVDVNAFAAEFTRRDAARQGMGALSPRDSVVADLGGARLVVDYGRPFRRGRSICGSVVPWGEVWRTGANAATGFSSSRDLEIGGAAVPAGRYTLWTLPTPEGWTLIINRETGQWGTEYHPEQDLVRVEMRTRTLAEPVDEFTIRLDPGQGGLALRVQWDRTEAWVPVTLK
jgi:hypothetical protein